MVEISEILNNNSNLLYFYSPYSFIKEISYDLQVKYINDKIISSLSHSEPYIYKTADGDSIIFIFDYLDWDTKYFGMQTYKLQHILYEKNKILFTELCKAVNAFVEMLKNKGCNYCFIEIPSEDILSVQALNIGSFRLIETRLTYYKGQLASYSNERYGVRNATVNDIPNLKEVAKSMRNDYDRFHADETFSVTLADEFLATYIEQSIKGFADYVMVPDEPNLPADSFLTAKYLKNDWSALGCNVSKMVLSAVSSKTNKGWYKKLISEMTYHLREIGAGYIFMNTQSTNRAVFHTWETLGYKLGCTTHILAAKIS